MKRRGFIQNSIALVAGMFVLPKFLGGSIEKKTSASSQPITNRKHTLIVDGDFPVVCGDVLIDDYDWQYRVVKSVNRHPNGGKWSSIVDLIPLYSSQKNKRKPYYGELTMFRKYSG